MKNSVKVMIAFILGQATQVVIHAVSFNFWESRQIPFCIAGGFLVAVAVFMGMRVAKQDEPPKPVSYLDFVEGDK